MTSASTSIGNKTTKVKRLKENKFCVFCFLLFGFCFVVGLFFLYVSIKPKKFFITKNMVITYKFKHNRWFLPQSERFCHGLGFFSFCLNRREITKEIEEIEIKKCVTSVMCEYIMASY
jgi:hypothetical protein